MSSKSILDKTLEELIEGMIAETVPSSGVEQKKVAAQKIMLEILIASLKNSSEKADKLANRVFWLNIILTVITTLGVIIAYLSFVRP